MEGDHRVVHRELVGAGQRVGFERSLQIGRARQIECAHVGAGGHADAGRVGHRILGAALLVVEGLHGAQRVERRD
jgi:hypothetical protein